MRILYISLMCLLCCSIADAHDWPMFQHDLQHSGFSPSKMPEHLRKVRICEEYDIVLGISTDEGKLFLTRPTSLSALDINTGSVLWNVLPKGILFLVCSPTVAENRLYISGTHGVFCLDADTGEVVWKHEVKSVDLCSSPVVVGNHVIVGGGEPLEPGVIEYAKRVLCLDAETGELVWSFTADDLVESSPAHLDGRVYVNAGRYIYCLDEQTGQLVWERKIEHVSFSSLSLDEERIFVGTSSGIICLQQETGEMLWKFDCGERIFTTPAVAYSKIFFGTPEGVFYCLDARNGEVIWKTEIGNRISCSAVVADRKVAFGTNDGTLYIVNAESGKILKSYNLGEDGISVLALSDGKLFVGQDRGRITCFEESLLEKYAVFIGAVIALFVVLLIVIKWKKSA